MILRLFLFLTCAIGSATAQYDSLYLRNRAYEIQRALHAAYRTDHADVVMLGNSITYGANWSELLGRPGVVNRGIGGDNTYGFIARLPDVIRLHPKLCFIMGGINDIFADIPVDTVFKNYCTILRTLQSNSIIPIIQSTLYVSLRWNRAGEKNPVVTTLNDRLRAYAAEHRMTFIDLNAQLSDGAVLRDEFTSDGVHLTAPGYIRWAHELDRVLTSNGL